MDIPRNYEQIRVLDKIAKMHRVYLSDTILSRNSDTIIAPLSCAPYITVEVGMYRVGYRALYDGIDDTQKHFEIKLIQFYFSFVLPIDTMSWDTHNARITHFRTWIVCAYLYGDDRLL